MPQPLASKPAVPATAISRLLDALDEGYWFGVVAKNGLSGLVGHQLDRLQRHYLDQIPLAKLEAIANQHQMPMQTAAQIRRLVDAWLVSTSAANEVQHDVLPAIRKAHPDTLAAWTDQRLVDLWRGCLGSLVRHCSAVERLQEAAKLQDVSLNDNNAVLMLADLRQHFGTAVVDNLVRSGKLAVLDHVEQLPEELTRGFTAEQMANAAGITAPDTTVYLVASRISRAQTAGVFLHEVGEHAGLPSMLGDDYPRLCTQFDRLLQDGDAYALWSALRVPKSTPAHQIQSERLAYLVEKVANDHFAAFGGEGGHRLGSEMIHQLRAWLFTTDLCRSLSQEGLLDAFHLSAQDIASLARQAVNAHAATVADAEPLQASHWAEQLSGALLDQLFAASPRQRNDVLAGMELEARIAYLYCMSALNAPSIQETLDHWAPLLHSLGAAAPRPGLRALANGVLDEGRRITTRNAVERQLERVGVALWRDASDTLAGQSLYVLSPSAKFEGQWQVSHFSYGSLGDVQYQDMDDGLAVVPNTAVPVPDADVADALQVLGLRRPERHDQEQVNGLAQWFGKSQVVDDDGRPLVMYHGTYAGEIDVFDRLRTTQFRRPSMDTVGIWFSDRPGRTGAGMYASSEGAAIYPVFLRAERTKYYDVFEDFLRDMHEAEGRRLEDQSPKGVGSAEGLRAKLKAEGYDSIGFTQTFNADLAADIAEMVDAVDRAKNEEFSVPRQERAVFTAKRARLEESLLRLRTEQQALGTSTEFDGQNVIVVLDPDQIKSAIGNTGQYERSNPDIRFSFAGSRACAASASKLSAAIDQLARGVDAENVRQETGWFQGGDNKWRFEIDDSQSLLKLWGDPTVHELKDANNGDWITAKDFKTKYPDHPQTQRMHEWALARVQRTLRYPAGVLSIGDILDHPTLLNTYPWVSDIPFLIDDSIPIGEGVYTGSGDGTVRAISIGYVADPIEARSIILHEIQHAIQEFEGFALGADIDPPFEPCQPDHLQHLGDAIALRGLVGEMGVVITAHTRAAFTSITGRELSAETTELASRSLFSLKRSYREAKIGMLSSHERYWRQASEVEARNVQARLHMSAEERRALAPSATQSVQDADVINGDGVLSYHEQLVSAHHGQLNMVLSLRRGDEQVGQVEYSTYNDQPAIQMIRVNAEHQRRGYATLIVQELQRRHPGQAIDFGQLTSEGAAWYRALPKRTLPTQAASHAQALIVAQAKRAELIELCEQWREDPTTAPVLEAERAAVFDSLNELHDAIDELEQQVDGQPLQLVLIETDEVGRYWHRAGSNSTPVAQHVRRHSPGGAPVTFNDWPGIHVGNFADIPMTVASLGASLQADAVELRRRADHLSRQSSHAVNALRQTRSALGQNLSTQRLIAAWGHPLSGQALSWDQAVSSEQRRRLGQAVPIAPGQTGGDVMTGLLRSMRSPSAVQELLLKCGINAVRHGSAAVMWDRASFALADELDRRATSEVMVLSLGEALPEMNTQVPAEPSRCNYLPRP